MESLRSAGGMVRLGFAFMWSALVASLAEYLTRAMITLQIGIEAVGIFGAAFALSGMLMNFILNAMCADYFPRLSGAADNPGKMTRLVSEQQRKSDFCSPCPGSRPL